MAEESVRDIAKLDLPFGRIATVREVTFESGLRMRRLVLREGHRITQVDLDDASVTALCRALSDSAGTPET